ncbi:hypothetical protein LSAT2_009034 [Lamellibrachia satsuma]|nr:hypothetical protein LSAT2_009034 [Lamellibrachia satsuma]
MIVITIMMTVVTLLLLLLLLWWWWRVVVCDGGGGGKTCWCSKSACLSTRHTPTCSSCWQRRQCHSTTGAVTAETRQRLLIESDDRLNNRWSTSVDQHGYAAVVDDMSPSKNMISVTLLLLVVGCIATSASASVFQCRGECGVWTFICLLRSRSTEKFATCLRGNKTCVRRCQKKANKSRPDKEERR